MKKIMIAGASSGVGKTTITLGLLYSLKQRGLAVQPYKVGPDYVDTEFHTRIAQTASRNLDSFLVPDPNVLRFLFEQQASQADIAVIEGAMGLYDGFGIDKNCCSSAAIAKELACPVLLIIDAKAASTSVAAIVKGFQVFDPEVAICGILLNNIASENHYELVKGAIEKYTNVEVLGYLRKNVGLQLPSRQLGLVPDIEIDNLIEKVAEISQMMEKTLNIDRIIALAKEDFSTTTAVHYPDYSQLTVAYAQDQALHFYYQDNLELLKNYHVKLLSFSPMKDNCLPEADFYYFGGGYPEEFAQELADNQAMKQAIYEKSYQGKFILAECGGLMYLGETLQVEQEKYPMVGIFAGKSQMTPRLKKFGYCEGEMRVDTFLGKKGTRVYGHEFHHSTFESSEEQVMNLRKIRDDQLVSEWGGGYQKRNTFASYLHVHFYQQPTFLMQLLDRVLEEKQNGVY